MDDSAYGHLHLRDFFAAFALAGIAAANTDQDYKIDAAMAYGYADAMMAQRENEIVDPVNLNKERASDARENYLRGHSRAS